MKTKFGETDSIVWGAAFLFILIIGSWLLFFAGSEKIVKTEVVKLNYVGYKNSECIFQKVGTWERYILQNVKLVDCEMIENEEVNITYSYVKDLFGEGSFKILQFH